MCTLDDVYAKMYAKMTLDDVYAKTRRQTTGLASARRVALVTTHERHKSSCDDRHMAWSCHDTYMPWCDDRHM